MQTPLKDLKSGKFSIGNSPSPTGRKSPENKRFEISPNKTDLNLNQMNTYYDIPFSAIKAAARIENANKTFQFGSPSNKTTERP